MNYDNPQLLDRLAAEYVLGTMPRLPRARFERLLRDSQAARDAVSRWQETSADLSAAVRARTPPPRIWRGIVRRMDPPAGAGSIWLRLWAGLATAGLMAMLIFVAVLDDAVPPAAPLPGVTQVSFVNESNLQPLWVISVDLTSGELSTQAVSATARSLDEVYELWMLPEQGNPRSLGLLPVDGASASVTFSPALIDLLKQAQGLAVSIEPSGGSPTGVPTGPVVYQASLFEL